MDQQLIQRCARVVFLLCLAVHPVLAQGILPGILRPVPAAGGAPPTPVSAVNAMQGSLGVCSGSSTCSYTLPFSPTTGNTVVLAVTVNHGNATLSVTGFSGTGCPTSLTLATNVSTANNAMGLDVWTGVAAGTGTCVVSLSAGGFFSNWDAGAGEFANAIGVDTFGSAANNSASTLAITAGGATTVAGDYAIVIWGANAASGSPTASGWTSAFNASFLGAFIESSLASGVTPSFSGSPISNGSAENIGIMIVLKA